MLIFGNIRKGLKEAEAARGSLLVDVREAGEYAMGHIPGAVNAPLSALSEAALPKDRPLFLYCLHGSRSLRAVHRLKKQGYEARSIGGIHGYTGPLERQEEKGDNHG